MKLFAFVAISSEGTELLHGVVESMNMRKARIVCIGCFVKRYPGELIKQLDLMEVDPAKCRNFIEANFNIDKEPS